MSEIVSPSNSCRGAAQQVVIELIRAGKLGPVNDGATIIAVYEKLVAEYERINKK